MHTGITGQPHHLCRHIGAVVIDHMVIAIGRRQRTFLRPARSADDRRTKGFQPLPCQQANPAGRRMKQHHITRLHGIAVTQQIGDRQPLQHDGSAHLKGNRIRKPDDKISLDGPMCGIGPVRDGVGNTVANRQRGHPLANRLDHAGRLAAKDQIALDRPGIGTGADIDIDEIDADSHMPDHHLASGRCRHVDIDLVNYLWSACCARCHCICHLPVLLLCLLYCRPMAAIRPPQFAHG